MKNILIIAPHYPPSNLTAVHRTRLFAQHLPSFGWNPIILTVHENYYEEALDWSLHKLLPPNQRIVKVKAFKITKPRLIGDIGLRGFFQLRKTALNIIRNENIDFVYIPIPSFYTALIGQYLYKKTGVKFGIDYIDPWVHKFPGSEKIFSRHWFSTKLSKLFEPFAVRNASLITSVADGYYKGVIQRNPELIKNCIFGAMPYGGEISDHEAIDSLGLKPFLFKKNNKTQLVYAGAMLPNAYSPLDALFNAIKRNRSHFNDVEFHFIGTGFNANDPSSYNIKTLARKYELWGQVVFEYPKRIPYLDVLVHLKEADAIFIIGTTEAHYTPSKIYQAALSKKPILALLHKDSLASTFIYESKIGKLLTFEGDSDWMEIFDSFAPFFKDFKNFIASYDPVPLNTNFLDLHSSRKMTEQLALLINKSLSL